MNVDHGDPCHYLQRVVAQRRRANRRWFLGGFLVVFDWFCIGFVLVFYGFLVAFYWFSSGFVLVSYGFLWLFYGELIGF